MVEDSPSTESSQLMGEQHELFPGHVQPQAPRAEPAPAGPQVAVPSRPRLSRAAGPAVEPPESTERVFDVVAASEGRGPWSTRTRASTAAYHAKAIAAEPAPVCMVSVQITRGSPEPLPERVESLQAALTKAKQTITELRARIVRADTVAEMWRSASDPENLERRKCGLAIRRILQVDGDASLKTALAELQALIGKGEP